MTRAELIQAVALRMDEITPAAGLDVTVDGSDNNPLYELIDGLVNDGVLELYSVAPYWRLKQKSFVYSNALANSEIQISTVGTRKIIRLKISDDFLRVAEITCADFQRPITEVFPEQSTEGRRQHNRFLMGKEAKPVGVMSHGMWGSFPCREIDCYSLSADTAVESSNVDATYIPKPKVIDDESSPMVSVEAVVPATLIGALEWLIAARAFGARGDVSQAQICQQNAQNLII